MFQQRHTSSPCIDPQDKHRSISRSPMDCKRPRLEKIEDEKSEPDVVVDDNDVGFFLSRNECFRWRLSALDWPTLVVVETRIIGIIDILCAGLFGIAIIAGEYRVPGRLAVSITRVNGLSIHTERGQHGTVGVMSLICHDRRCLCVPAVSMGHLSVCYTLITRSRDRVWYRAARGRVYLFHMAYSIFYPALILSGNQSNSVSMNLPVVIHSV